MRLVRSDWGTKTLSVRINGLDTPYWYRDVVELLENASERLDQIMIPKVGCAADLYAVDALVTAVERAQGRTKQIAFEVIIESAAGIAHVEEIAAATPRLQAMSLGAADFAASMGMATTGIGGTQANYYMHHEGKTIGQIHGIGRNLPLLRHVAHMVFCRSMAHTVIFQMMKVSAHRPVVRRHWVWLANGPSTPNKLPYQMKCSPLQKKL